LIAAILRHLEGILPYRQFYYILKWGIIMGIFDLFSKKTAQEYFNEGVAFEEKENYSAAAVSYNKAVNIDPLFEPSYVPLFNVLLELGRFKEAWEVGHKVTNILNKRIISENPNDPKVWLMVGVNLYNDGRYSEAISAYEKALTLDPNYEHAKQNRLVAQKKLLQSARK
jgi:tetratricopeptide (TPR) repeat protein